MDSAQASATAEEARLRRRAILLVVAIFVVNGLLQTGYFHWGARATGSLRPFMDSFLSETTGAAASAITFFLIIIPVCRRWPLGRGHWTRHLPPHVGGLIVYSVVKTFLMWGMRLLLWPLAGLGPYDYGDLAYRFPMEFANDVWSYVVLASIVHAFYAWRALRDRELREARLEASLSEARLQALQGQLQPHFLFNTLNVISSVMYADPEQADRLMSRLSDLLRSSLSAPQRPEVALEEEMHVLGQYIDIMRARYGDRLDFNTHVDPEAREARVPAFLLQPLVENAIQHGVAKRAGSGRVDVRVERQRAMLVLHVIDDGPGIAGDPNAAIGRGVGLLNTRERLAHLHGSAASLTLANRREGGLVATVRIPYARAASSFTPVNEEPLTVGALSD
jgi:signal transduction histidine kinase